MYHYFHGELAILDPTYAVIECGGVGYRLGISMLTFKKLSDMPSDDVRLYSHLSVKEDAMELYGFYDESELMSFRQLISISGVGPKAAVSILSELSSDQLAVAIVTNDTKALSRAQGVGPKLAQRIILELKDKIKNETLTEITDKSSEILSLKGSHSEAIEALCALGYSKNEAYNAVTAVNASENDQVDYIIRAALKGLMKNSSR